MPIGLDKAPQTLPKAAQSLWVKTFNGVFDSCKGTADQCDEAAAKLAWAAVKKKYRKMKDKWIAKSEYEDSYHDLLLTITKASLQPDGSVRWQAVASDTGRDKADERTSVDLFQDWIDRVTYNQTVPYLPEPKMPFLGVSHYPALEGYGEAGETYRMYIDGDCFKADGIFKVDSPIGQKLLDAVKVELALIKKGGQVEKPIRISAGWWDIEHYHDDSNYLFTRKSLTDKCPICEKGQTSDKIYKAGQLDHFAATRVPMNVRTSLELKSMAKKITRREDAESIIGPDEAEEMERRARMVGKSETEDELPAAMATKADNEDEIEVTRGGYMRDMRKKRKMTMADVAKALEVTEARLKRLEDDEEEMDDDMMAFMADVYKMSDKEKEAMLARFGKKRKEKPPMKEKAMMKTVGGEEYPAGDFLVVEDAESPSTWRLQVKRKGTPDHGLMGAAWAALHGGYRGNKYEGPMKGDALDKLKKLYTSEEMDTPVEKMDYGEGEMMEMPMRPLGGATSLKEAENYIATQEKMDRMYSYWDMMKMAYHNIQQGMMEPADKLKAASNLFREMGAKIDTLKAGLSDAFLIQESAAAYEDYEDDDEAGEDYIFEESDEVNIMSDENTHPADKMKAAIDAALANKSLGREGQETAIQEAFNGYAQEVQSQLEAVNPAPQAEQIAKSVASEVAKALGPIAEQIGLLTAKMNQQAAPHPQSGQGLQEVYFPQQKSMGTGQAPQPVQVEGGNRVSPVTGKPSPLTDIIRKSVGLNN